MPGTIRWSTASGPKVKIKQKRIHPFLDEGFTRFAKYFHASYVQTKTADLRFLELYVLLAGVYLTNPLEILPVCIIEQQLCSESVLLVRRSDVLSRWTDTCDLNPLINQTDARWRQFNVLGRRRVQRNSDGC